MPRHILIFAVYMAVSLVTPAFPSSLTLYPVFCNGAVLQRNAPIKIWGKGSEGQAVTVRFADQTLETTVKDERWSVVFPAMKAGGPYVLLVQSKDGQIRRQDILIGDVWLCGGQSNMETTMRWYVQPNGRTGEKWELFQKVFSGVPGEYQNNHIRHIKIKIVSSDTPQLEPELVWSWRNLTPELSMDLSATAYFFARRLQPEIGVPVGLVVAALGGTPITAWMPWSVLDSKSLYQPIRTDWEAALAAYPVKKGKYDEQMAAYRSKYGLKPGDPLGPSWKEAPRIPYGPEHDWRPAGLYNGMIAPLDGLNFTGIIWYQGEADTLTPDAVDRYQELFPDLIRQWRSGLDQPDLPFLYVQLPSYLRPNSQDRIWPAMRQAQADARDKVDNAYMTVAIDAGRADDIHPPFKRVVGERLARSALANVYHKISVGSGPRIRGVDFSSDTAEINFSQIGGGLMIGRLDLTQVVAASSDTRLQGFSLAGQDQKFYPANAVISGVQVILTSGQVEAPAMVRYAWEDVSPANLYNREGFPAEPFEARRFGN
ncbi:MAG: sialate O-acetylesterase [Kiritimatiellales bacterium]